MRHLVLAVSLVAVVGCALDTADPEDEESQEEDVEETEQAASAPKCAGLSTFTPLPRAPSGHLRILTWNIRLGASDAAIEKNGAVVMKIFPENATTQATLCTHLRTIALQIARENPDVVVLNEVDVNVARSKGLDEVNELRNMLKMPRAYFGYRTRMEYCNEARSTNPATARKAFGRGSGVAVLTRLPVTATKVVRVNPQSAAELAHWSDADPVVDCRNGQKRTGTLGQTQYFNAAKRDVVLYADVTVAGKSIRIAATHPEASTSIKQTGNPDVRIQEAEAARIRNVLASHPRAILAGDMNITFDPADAPPAAHRRAYCLLAGGRLAGDACSQPTRADAWLVAGAGNRETHKTSDATPGARYDFMFASPSLVPTKVDVLPTFARAYKLSDHAPVVATFRVN